MARASYDATVLPDGRRLGPHLPMASGMVKAADRAAAIGATALQSGYDKRVVKAFFFKLSRALAVFYLILLLLVMLLEPFSPKPGMELFTVSSYFLSPIQGLVVAAITVLFTSHEKAASASSS